MTAPIDIHRIEERFLILPENFEAFLKDISKVLRPQAFSQKKVSRTIYFNNDDCPVPWGYSLKARMFLPDFSSEISISPEDIYRIEIKGRKEGNLRDKLQKELPIFEATQFINEHLGSQMPGVILRPYAADEYLREHFVSQEEKLLRLTVDWDIRYAYFEENSYTAVWTGKDNFARIELKVAPERMKSEEHKRVLEIIAKYSPLPIISKRARAFHLASIFLDKKGSNLKKELQECEIEAKFLVRHSNPASLFLALKRYLQKNIIYTVAPHYPYTKEEGGINYYWAQRNTQGETVEGLKLRFLGRAIKTVFKKSTVIVPDSFGLGCILERQEKKGKVIDFTQKDYDGILKQAEKDLGPLEFIGYLFRSRRAFWPENVDTGRVYHISLDQCTSYDGRVIYQLEVEYTGRYFDRFRDRFESKKSETEIKEIIHAEVAELSHKVLSFCNKNGKYLIPTTLTKFDWLRVRTQ